MVDDIVRTTLIRSLKVQRHPDQKDIERAANYGAKPLHRLSGPFPDEALSLLLICTSAQLERFSMSTLKKFRATNVSTISVQHGFPMLLSLKRLGTRIMPSGKMVAEYHSDQLKATIILPMMF